MNVRFKISEDKFFNNGKSILNAIPNVEKRIKKALSQEEEIEFSSRNYKGKPEYEGITAASLNEALRRCLSAEKFKGETHVENGVFFHQSKEGFDFSEYDEEYNKVRLYNYYQGTVGILNGDVKILELYKKMGYKKKEWKGKIEEIRVKVKMDNCDAEAEKVILTVVGELQFGNWALLYRDFFRLLEADDNPGVDLYIYVTADDELSKLLSANTVSYGKADKFIGESLSLIKTPIWLIGLGIDRI